MRLTCPYCGQSWEFVTQQERAGKARWRGVDKATRARLARRGWKTRRARMAAKRDQSS